MPWWVTKRWHENGREARKKNRWWRLEMKISNQVESWNHWNEAFLIYKSVVKNIGSQCLEWNYFVCWCAPGNFIEVLCCWVNHFHHFFNWQSYTEITTICLFIRFFLASSLCTFGQCLRVKIYGRRSYRRVKNHLTSNHFKSAYLNLSRITVSVYSPIYK